MATSDLSLYPVHLGLGATVIREPKFDGMDWYEAYEKRHAPDGIDARLVSMHTFEESWTMWEMHPHGAELVLCTAGRITLIQETERRLIQTTLTPGQFAINEAGIWHTADVSEAATAVFITAGTGTQHRPRS